MDKRHWIAIILVTILSAVSKTLYAYGEPQLGFIVGAMMCVVCVWGIRDAYNSFFKY
jgi:hypothetical protein